MAAYPLVIEHYFRPVLFNYIFSNGDAHLKNFSLIQTDMGDYTLSPAYDLVCTVLHTQNEEDTAVDLYKGDIDSPFTTMMAFWVNPISRYWQQKWTCCPNVLLILNSPGYMRQLQRLLNMCFVTTVRGSNPGANVSASNNTTFNTMEKWLDAIEENKKLYERLLQVEREKVSLLKRMLGEKKK